MPRTRKTQSQADTPNTDTEYLTPEEDNDRVEAEIAAETKLTAKELAASLDTDPKAFRRWLRRFTDNRAGKGGRWTFTTDEAEAIRAAYKKNDAEATDEVPADA